MTESFGAAMPQDEEFSPEVSRLVIKRGTAPRRKPEREIVKEGIGYIKDHGGYAWKIHGGPMGHVGEPDVDGCLHGRALKFEAKAVGNRPTGPQEAAMRRWASVGALVGWFRSTEHIGQLLDHLNEIDFMPDLVHPGCTCSRHAEGGAR